MTLPFRMPTGLRPANAVTTGPPAPAIDPDSPRAGLAYPVRHHKGWEKWAFVADAIRSGAVDDLPIGTPVVITKRSIRWVLVATPTLMEKPMLDGGSEARRADAPPGGAPRRAEHAPCP